jgi:hypothetical protein
MYKNDEGDSLAELSPNLWKKVSFAESLEESIFCRIFGRKDLSLIRISDISHAWKYLL